MRSRAAGVQGTIPDHVLVASNQMELVRGYCYLGSHVEADGTAARRYVGALPSRETAWAASSAGSGRQVFVSTQLRLFKAYILPVLLHGTETWTLTRALETKLDVFQRWCLRRILRVHFSAHV